jgi:tetratricopeptide (TPR) repeat protein
MNTLRAFRWAAAVLLALQTIQIFFVPHTRTPDLWGFTTASYFAGPLQSIFYICSILATLFILRVKNIPDRATESPGRQPKTRPAKKKASPSPQRPRVEKRWLPIVGGCAIAAVAFWFLHNAWAFLGDGTLYLGYVYKYSLGAPMVLSWRESVPMFLFQMLYHFQTGKPSTVFPFRFIDLVAGLGFVVVAMLFVRRLFPEKVMRHAALALLFSTAGVLFFFCYIETYALGFSAVLLYLYVGYLYLCERRPHWQLAVALGAAVLLHSSNLLLIPSAIVLVALRRSREHNEKPSLTRYYKSFVPITVILIGLYILFQYYPIAPLETADNPFIPLHSVRDLQYTLFSKQHILDILNEHFLLSAVATVLLLSLVMFRRSMFGEHPYLVFLIYVLFFQEAFVIGGYPTFGMARDWDIFAPLGITMTILVLSVLHFDSEIALRRKAVLQAMLGTSIVASLQLGMWLFVNLNTLAAATRYEDILSVYRPLVSARNTQYGYENLRKLYMTGKNYSRQLYAVRKMTEVLPWPFALNSALVLSSQLGKNATSQDWQNYRSILDTLNTLPDSTLEVEEMGEEHLRLNPPHSSEPNSDADMYETMVQLGESQMGMTADEAHARARSFIANHPLLSQGHELEGSLFLEQHDAVHAIPELERAIQLDSNRTFSHVRLAVAYIQNGQYDKVSKQFRAGLALDSTFIAAYVEFANYLIVSKTIELSDVQFLEQKVSWIMAHPEGMERPTLSKEEILKIAQDILDKLHEKISNQLRRMSS